MTRLLLQRLATAVPVLFLVSLVTFGLMHLIPGDPAAAIAGASATPDQIAQIRHDLDLDAPFLVQLLHYYTAMLFHGDLGRSILLGDGVVHATFDRLPISLGLAFYGLLITLALGLVLGIVSALRHNSWIDQGAMVVAMFGISVPPFWLALLMIIFFSVQLGWLPTGGYVPFMDNPWQWIVHMTMPALSLALLQVGLLARITRSTMLEVLRQDFVRTARAKGLPRRLVVFKHAFANALVPITAVVSIVIGLLISGSVVTETIFAIPGIGQLVTSAVLNRDYPMVQGALLIVTALLVMVNIFFDLLAAILDPRVRDA